MKAVTTSFMPKETIPIEHVTDRLLELTGLAFSGDGRLDEFKRTEYFVSPTRTILKNCVKSAFYSWVARIDRVRF